MKIAFWNGVNYIESPTDYLAAIGCVLAMLYQCKVVLGSNEISSHMLQDCFLHNVKEEQEYAHLYYSSPEYHRRLWEMKRNRYSAITELPMEGVSILYPPDVNEDIFYYEVPRETFYMVGIAGENYISIQRALEDAELIVIILPPDVEGILSFFQSFSLFIPKSIIIIDGYLGKWSQQRIAESKYGFAKQSMKSIPKSIEFKTACEEGKLDLFILDNLKCSTANPNYKFFTGLKYVAQRIYEYSIKREEQNE